VIISAFTRGMQAFASAASWANQRHKEIYVPCAISKWRFAIRFWFFANWHFPICPNYL